METEKGTVFTITWWCLVTINAKRLSFNGFDYVIFGNEPEAWKIFLWPRVKKHRDHVDRCTSHRNVDETLIKIADLTTNSKPLISAGKQTKLDILGKIYMSYALWKGVKWTCKKYRPRSACECWSDRLTFFEGLCSALTEFSLCLTHSHTMTPIDAPGKQAFWKHSG